ncbi:unnamed protein product, partial [marine sediment metagenome]
FDCDTDHSCNRRATEGEIEFECARLWGDRRDAYDKRWVIFTGGEPAMHLDRNLIRHFRSKGWKCAVETNGSLRLPPGLDWITVSPRRQVQTVVRLVDEVKCVVAADGELPEPTCLAAYYLLSPAFKGLEPDPAAIARCVQLVKDNPKWRLTIQFHKLLNIR